MNSFYSQQAAVAHSTAYCPLPTANSFRKGQSAKVTESFSENLTKMNISELKISELRP
jgi:hypothetical protein